MRPAPKTQGANLPQQLLHLIPLLSTAPSRSFCQQQPQEKPSLTLVIQPQALIGRVLTTSAETLKPRKKLWELSNPNSPSMQESILWCHWQMEAESNFALSFQGNNGDQHFHSTLKIAKHFQSCCLP